MCAMVMAYAEIQKGRRSVGSEDRVKQTNVRTEAIALSAALMRSITNAVWLLLYPSRAAEYHLSGDGYLQNHGIDLNQIVWL